MSFGEENIEVTMKLRGKRTVIRQSFPVTG